MSPIEGDDWLALETADGSWTLRSATVGEACHSASGAWTEARERYGRFCRKGARRDPGGRARCGGHGDPGGEAGGHVLRLLDVGTGLGLNVAAALCELAHEERARLEVVTLERDPAVIRASFDLPLPTGGPERAAMACVRTALGTALARRPKEVAVSLDLPAAAAPTASPTRDARGRLRLLLGDARRTLPALEESARFDVVFLDPFSPGRAPELWEAPFLAEVARRMAPGGLLCTYSAAFRVRARLAAAGLRVGRGPRVGAKAEGTLASPDLDLPPLPERVRARLERLAPGSPAAVRETVDSGRELPDDPG